LGSEEVDMSYPQQLKSQEFELQKSSKKLSPSPSQKELEFKRLYGGQQEKKKVYVPVLQSAYEAVKSPMEQMLKSLEKAERNSSPHR